MDDINWEKIPSDFLVHAPVRFSPGKSDPDRFALNPPSAQSHLLGTTRTGADVLSGLIHGARYSLMIGCCSMLIALFIGIVMGGLAGYFGDYSITCSRYAAAGVFLLILPAWYYAFGLFPINMNDAIQNGILSGLIKLGFRTGIFIFICLLPIILPAILKKTNRRSGAVSIPVDSIISRFIELFVSIPRLVLIVTLSAIMRPSLTGLILIIGLTSWTEIARIFRAEILRLRTLEFVQASRVSGASDLRTLISTILPNAIAPVTIFFFLGIAGAILTEAGLSFLGIGVPHSISTWGSLLFAGRENFEAWWLVVFPGLAVFLLLWSLHNLGDYLKQNIPGSRGRFVNNF